MNRHMEKIGTQAKDLFLVGAKSVAKVGEYPIHLITNKEVVKYVERPVSTIKTMEHSRMNESPVSRLPFFGRDINADSSPAFDDKETCRCGSTFFHAWMKFSAVMLAASLLIWQLVEKIRSYVENPVIVSPEYTYVQKLDFPGLILCNSQPLRYTNVINTPFAKILNETTLAHGSINMSDPIFAQELSKANAIDLRQFYFNATQTAIDFVISCKWPSDNAICNDSNFQLVITDYGPCYRLTSSTWQQMTAAGSVNSLQIVLNVDTAGSFPSTSSKTVGAFIALFPYDDPTPVVSQIGFKAPPGFETSISVTSEYVKRLSSDKKGTCEPKRQLALYRNYTTVGCYAENHLKNRINSCSCTPYNTPTYRNVKAKDEENENLIDSIDRSKSCNAEQQFGCVDELWEMDADLVPVHEQAPCPDACETYRYTSELTYSLISPRRLQLSLSKEKKENIERNIANLNDAKRQHGETMKVDVDQYYKENFIILNIHFKELVRVKIEQKLMYEGLNFAGDIAGTIGIILGFLLTTLGEVIENCHMLYKKLRGIVDPGTERVVKIVQKEERLEPEQDPVNGRLRKDADETCL